MFTNNTIQKKVNRTYTIEKQLADRFKQTSDKDARKMSNVVESYIRRYVESKS
jgi:ribosomal protein S2